MFATLSSWVSGGRVLELFSGVGALSVLLAAHVDKMVTVENNQASVELAKATMRRLGHSHIDADVVMLIRWSNARRGRTVRVLVVDPPGKGLDPG